MHATEPVEQWQYIERRLKGPHLVDTLFFGFATDEEKGEPRVG
jgi:hypothetical protein